jgi:hypothetical protein
MVLPASPVSVHAPGAVPVPTGSRPGAIGSGRSFGAVLEARTAADPGAAHARPSAATVGPPLGERAATALRSIDAARARLDGLLAAARSGRTFSPQELLALQGEAYRYAQAVELSVKLAEQGAQAVKQALHAQV